MCLFDFYISAFQSCYFAAISNWIVGSVRWVKQRQSVRVRQERKRKPAEQSMINETITLNKYLYWFWFFMPYQRARNEASKRNVCVYINIDKKNQNQSAAFVIANAASSKMINQFNITAFFPIYTYLFRFFAHFFFHSLISKCQISIHITECFSTQIFFLKRFFYQFYLFFAVKFT